VNAPAEQRFLTLQELVAAAKSNLPPGPWSYLIGGAETETTVRRNRHALDCIAFRPRVLRDVSHVDCSATFFGKPIRLPVMLAPIGGLESLVEGGAATAARAAAQFGVPQMLSSVCKPGLEETAAAAQTIRSFQLYVRGDDAWVDDFVRRAKDNGFTSFCFTVDVASYSRRERDLVGRFVKPWRAKAQEGAAFQAALSWDQVKRFKDRHDLPLIIKGIATVEDAEIAVQHGVEVVYVSNHGGRQLDHCRAGIELLPEVISVARGKAEFIVDGGFLRGTDVLKAVARGAAMVGIGKLQALALGAAGEQGIVRMLEILETELTTAMKLLGVNELRELDGTYMQPATPVTTPGTLSALPLL